MADDPSLADQAMSAPDRHHFTAEASSSRDNQDPEHSKAAETINSNEEAAQVTEATANASTRQNYTEPKFKYEWNKKRGWYEALPIGPKDSKPRLSKKKKPSVGDEGALDAKALKRVIAKQTREQRLVSAIKDLRESHEDDVLVRVLHNNLNEREIKFLRAQFPVVESDISMSRDPGPVQWECLMLGEGSPKLLHQLARATPFDISRWVQHMAFRQFCSVRVGIYVAKDDYDKQKSLRLQNWAKNELCRAYLPSRGQWNSTEGYIEARTELSLDWKITWSSDTVLPPRPPEY